jgi:hypothetical protein
MVLAIFQSERVYEGNANFLNAVYPMPSISRVVFDPATQAGLNVLGSMHPSIPPLFREDSFDPTSRLRRGRFYTPDGTKQYNCARINHYPYAPPTGGFPLVYDMETYQSLQPTNPAHGPAQRYVLLGDTNHKTAWRIIGSERVFNGETLFTLKSANSLGVLPELLHAVLPSESRAQIEQGYEKLADAAYKYLPEPVVDVCREFSRILLAAWLPTVDRDPKGDLGTLARAVPDDRPIVRSIATIISRLHSRGKSSEQERQAEKGRQIRNVSHEDGELSVGLVACLLREFGWAV